MYGKQRAQMPPFSKILLIADYAVLLLLIVLHYTGEKDLTAIIIAWAAQIAISSGCYYWKSKAENLIKLPIQIIKELPADMREKADPNSIIASVVGIGTNNNNN